MSVAVMFIFFFNDTATTEIYTLSLHDALPILRPSHSVRRCEQLDAHRARGDLRPGVDHHPLPRRGRGRRDRDRKSTRLNSSHANISYAVFCLKNKTELVKEGYAVRSAAVLAED